METSRDPGFKIRDQDLKNRASEMQNQLKTRPRESLQTLPRFQDGVKIFRDPHFSRNHSIPLISYPEQVMNFFFASLVNIINLSLSATKWTFSKPMLFSFRKCQCWLWINGDSAIIIVYLFIYSITSTTRMSFNLCFCYKK